MPEIQIILTSPIGITSIASISPLGITLEETWHKYLKDGHCLHQKKMGTALEWVASLSGEAESEIDRLRLSNPKYKELDSTVLYAIYASRKAVEAAGWTPGDDFGINIGSSRGATALFEKYHEEYISEHRTSTLSSPTTTLGNISSWVAHDLGTRGPDISHSITCSTALHALLNGLAWIRSGMSSKFLVGGSEAPLTGFTIAQMKALKIYAGSDRKAPALREKRPGLPKEYPCLALHTKKNRNTMVLGEGASVACLESGVSSDTLAIVEGIGYATEPLEHNVSLSADAICFQRSMEMALRKVDKRKVDVIVMHAPGTLKGDRAEFNAIQKVFGKTTPGLTGNKWKTGHTFGASGMLSVEFAILMLQHNQFIKVPYLDDHKPIRKLQKILINAVGFGGNAVSILLKAPF